jgi:hypothetical protein
MSTELFETCRGFNKHIIEEIVLQIVQLPELDTVVEDMHNKLFTESILNGQKV